MSKPEHAAEEFFPCSGFFLLLALVVLASACDKRVVSARMPSPEKLACEAGERPLALRFYEGSYEWGCGSAACPDGEEAVWEPVRRSADRHGVQDVTARCLARCDSGKRRLNNGGCPGRYVLSSKFDGDTLIVAANVDQKPIDGVGITFDHPGLEQVTGTTNADGTARFDTSVEPFSSVLLNDMARSQNSFASGGGIGAMLAADWDARGSFRDGTVAATTVRVGSSAPYVGAKQEAAGHNEARIKGLQERCNGGDAGICLDLARLYQGRGRPKEAVAAARRSCNLGLQEACDDLASATAAEPKRNASSSPIGRCRADCEAAGSSIVSMCVDLGADRASCVASCQSTCQKLCAQGTMDGPCD